MRHILRARWLLPLAALCLLSSSCTREYDFTRAAPQRGTLGEELHAIWRKDAARADERPDERAAMLDRERAAFVQAVDAAAPEPTLRDVDQFFRDTLALVEDGSMPGLTRKAHLALEEASQDAALTSALAEPTIPEVSAFISPLARQNFIGYVAAYPELSEVGVRATRIVLDNDGFRDDGSPDPSEPDGASELIRGLAYALDDVQPQVLEGHLALATRDILLREDDRYAVAAEDSLPPLYVARFDRRGLPSAPVGPIGSPFTDADGDGLADIDDQGQFIPSIGDTLPMIAFGELGEGLTTRDIYGRAVFDQRPIFEYVDLRRTGLGFLVKEFAALSSQDVLVDFLSAARAIMGETTVLEDDRGPFQGFAPEHPLVDLTYAVIHLLAYESLPELLRDLVVVLDQASGALAGVVVALERAVDESDLHPNANLADNQTLAYDLIPILHELSAEPALWADVINALGDPMTKRAGEAMITLLSYQNTRAVVAPGGAYDACFQACKAQSPGGTEARFMCVRACPNEEIYQRPFDPNAPESPESRSQLQALWHLMWSLTGVPYVMETTEVRLNGSPSPLPPPLISLPGGAEAFLRATAGRLDLAEHVPPELFTGNELGPLLSAFGISSQNIAGLISLLSQLFGVQLDRFPTPDQLTRLFSQDDIRFASDDNRFVIDLAEPIDADGYNLAAHLADGLFEAEASGLIDAVVPIARAFSTHNREDLLLRLFGVLHKHYPGDASLYRNSAGQSSPSNAANLRSFESMMRAIFEEGSLFESLAELSFQLNQVRQSRGADLNEQLRVMLHHATRPDNFRTRAGADFMNLADGRTVSNLTRLHVALRALSDIADRVEADPEVEAKFSLAVERLLDVVLQVEWPQGEPARFAKPGAVALTVHGAEFVRDFALRERASGDLSGWLIETVYPWLVEGWTSRLLSGLVRIAEDLLQEPENRAALDGLLAYLTNTPQGRAQTALMAYQVVLRSTQVRVWVPLAKALARALDPDRAWDTGDALARLPLTSHGALTLSRIIEADTRGTGVQFIARATALPLDGDTSPAVVVGGIIADYWRADPSATTPYTSEDWRLAMSRAALWLADDDHGMEQLYDLVDMRVKPAEDNE